MYLALFITHAVSTTVIDQVLDAGITSGVRCFFLAEPEDAPPLEHDFEESTKTPIPTAWRSNFLGSTPEQCAAFLKALVPENADGDENDECRSNTRFAILDEHSTQSGKLLACNREEDESVTSLRFKPAWASLYLLAWYQDQWEDHVRLEAEHAASQKEHEDQRKSRRAALARHLNTM